MGTTIRSATPTAVRTVTYTGAQGQSIQLDYCNYTVSTRQVESARGVIKRVYRFSFQFIMSGANSSELRDIQVNAERILNQRAGVLVITEGNVEVFRCGPAQSPILQSANPAAVDGTVRQTLLTDIEWGPTPISLSIQPIGVGAYGQWVLDVTTASEDAFIVGDIIVLGVDAEVSYSIDQNHYSNRTVTGRIFIANWGRTASDPFGRNRLSQADAEPIRRALLSGQGEFTNRFMAPVRIPPNCRRTLEHFHVDGTENVIHFTIQDIENYRLYPTFITDADLRVQVHVGGVSAVQWVRHVITGYCEAPRDVAKGRVLQACWEQLEDAIGPLLTREVEGRKAAVIAYTFTNHAYRNRIEYSMVLVTPFGAFNFFNSLGIGNYRSSVFFPQGVGGSAQFFGSGYRLEPFTPRIAIAGEGATGNIDTGSFDDTARDNKNESKAIGGNELVFDIVFHGNAEHAIAYSLPANIEGISGVESYRRRMATFRFKVRCFVTYVTKRGQPPEVNYHEKFIEQLASVSGLVIESERELADTVVRTPLGPNDIHKAAYEATVSVTESLYQRIIEAGGFKAFTNAVRNHLAATRNDNLPEAIRKVLTGGQE